MRAPRQHVNPSPLSRPGDTIWLAPGVQHVVGNVRLDFPVHLRGGGKSPEETTVSIVSGVAVGLDFRATGLLANMSIHSGSIAPCVVHRQGHLRVDRCQLTTLSRGLDHLSSPIVTLAKFSPLSPAIPAAAVGGQLGQTTLPLLTESYAPQQGIAKQQRLTLDQRLGAAIDCGPGKLVVSDTRLSGGGHGVHCRGSGVLQSVRAIYGAGSMPLFFFEVDARLVILLFSP